MTGTGRYFDHAASTVPYEDALAASLDAAKQFIGNPSAMHVEGNAARDEMNRLKRRVTDCLNCDDGRVVLTSGGSESNNLVINSYLQREPEKTIAIAVNAHASMWYPVDKITGRTAILPVDDRGRLSMDEVKALDPDNISLCCINHVCNETGWIQNAAEISEICLRKGIPLLIDGVQAVGKIPIDLNAVPCDYYTVSGHKFGGPHGVGAVIVRGEACQPVIHGGSQEWGMRAGTQNLAGLAGLAEALELSTASVQDTMARNKQLAGLLLEGLETEGIHYLLNSSPDDTVTGILSLTFPGWKSQVIAAELMLKGVSVATGSACHADRDEPSRVIMAYGRSADDALGTIRISFGRDTSPEDVAELINAMAFLKP